MGSFYSGFGGNKSLLGHCDDGVIYSGSGNNAPIGRYENGNIYNQFKEHIGSYGGGSIYDVFGTHIASYDSGVVYNSYLNVAVGKEQVGSYERDSAEAAALVLLFLGGNAVNNGNYSAQEEHTTTTSNTTTYSSSDDSGTGCLSVLFNLIFLAIGAILKLLWPVIKIYFLALMLPNYVAASWFGFASGVLTILCSVAGLIPLTVIFVVAMSVPYLLFWPYWAILMWQRIKKHMEWKEVCSYYWKWFLKGPFAYPALAQKLGENNSMPKVENILNKVINWVKSLSKKKDLD